MQNLCIFICALQLFFIISFFFQFLFQFSLFIERKYRNNDNKYIILRSDTSVNLLFMVFYSHLCHDLIVYVAISPKPRSFPLRETIKVTMNLELHQSHLRREPVSYGGVHWIGRSSRAHKAVRVAWKGVASRGEAVGWASFSLTSTTGGLVAWRRRERLGPMHRAGWLWRHRSQKEGI